MMAENPQTDNHVTFAPSLETLTGDVRDFMLDSIRPMAKPWTKLAEWEQSSLAQAIEGKAREAVRKIVDLISTRNFPHVEVQVGKGTFKEGEIEAKITCPDSDENLIAIKNAGRCALVLADPKEFFGERAAAKVDKDQPEMDLSGTAGGETATETAPGGISPEAALKGFHAANEEVARKAAQDEALRAGLAGDRADAPDGLSSDDADQLLEASREAAGEKRARRRARAGTASDPTEEDPAIPGAPRAPAEAEA